MRGLGAKELDFTDQNIGRKIDGAGELDADFVLDDLRKPVNAPAFHASHHALANGKSPSVHASNLNVNGGPKINPRFTSSSPVPHQRGVTPSPLPHDDVGRYLKARVHELDRNVANIGGHDTLMVYHYEGGESERGDVSDVLSENSEANFDALAALGAHYDSAHPHRSHSREPSNAPHDVV